MNEKYIINHHKIFTGYYPNEKEVNRIRSAIESLKKHDYKMECLEQTSLLDSDIEALEFYERLSGKDRKCLSVYCETIIRIAECSPLSYSLMIKEKKSIMSVILGLSCLPILIFYKYLKGMFLYVTKKKTFDCWSRSCGNCGCSAV